MSKTLHLSMSIEGLENELKGMKTDDERRLYCFDSFGMSDSDVYELLESMKEIGLKYISSEGCDNKKPDGSCAGHPNVKKTEKP